MLSCSVPQKQQVVLHTYFKKYQIFERNLGWGVISFLFYKLSVKDNLKCSFISRLKSKWWFEQNTFENSSGQRKNIDDVAKQIKKGCQGGHLRVVQPVNQCIWTIFPLTTNDLNIDIPSHRQLVFAWYISPTSHVLHNDKLLYFPY